MTLSEKIGQMNQIASSTGAITGPMSERLSCDEAVKKGWCGSILGIKDPAEIERLQHLAVDSSRLGIPILFGHDIIHGCRTIFPENIGISCSWDLDAVERFARIAASEAAAFGVAWTFSPMCDICADPRWGRVSEGSGEDTFLSARIAESMVRGYQGDELADSSTILSCVKHFAAYGAPEAGRDYNTVDMSWSMFKDKYLPVYKAAIDAGAGTVMSSFNDFDAVPVTANSRLLRSVLRDTLGFGGFVVSDWGAVRELIAHGVAADERDAALLAFRAGVNMDMVSGCYLKSLESLVESGVIREKEIDDLVRPILKAKFALGLFDNPFRYGGEARRHEMYSGDNMQAARELARESMVLLTNNNGVLPLREGARIALIGPYADDRNEMIGAWRGMAEPDSCRTFLEGLCDRFGQSQVSVARGCDPRTDLPGGVAEAVALARRSDIVLLTLGLPNAESGEASSLSSLALPPCQKKLLRALHDTGKPVVILLVTGRPLELVEESALAQAVLVTWHPGTMAGPALADIVSGDCSPSGRLSMGFPRSEGQLPLRYNHKSTGRPLRDPASTAKYVSRYMDVSNEPLFCFGHGLSYTEFVYDNPVIENPVLSPGEDLRVSVRVSNTGTREATETVQLYVRDVLSSVTRPVRELKAFSRVTLRADQSVEVKMTIRYEDLCFTEASGRWGVEAGDFILYAGHDCSATLSAPFSVR
ncbi:MAG: glycoside hydrolase family 3 C-terminal domain-containing protein [Bacteroidales bacterium]|nr:glycoside hydrolase family 3 C-terminal domain-containing protein [Bacteroidales bacterium]